MLEVIFVVRSRMLKSNVMRNRIERDRIPEPPTHPIDRTTESLCKISHPFQIPSKFANQATSFVPVSYHHRMLSRDVEAIVLMN